MARNNRSTRQGGGLYKGLECVGVDRRDRATVIAELRGGQRASSEMRKVPGERSRRGA